MAVDGGTVTAGNDDGTAVALGSASATGGGSVGTTGDVVDDEFVVGGGVAAVVGGKDEGEPVPFGSLDGAGDIVVVRTEDDEGNVDGPEVGPSLGGSLVG